MAFCWTPGAKVPEPGELESLKAWLVRESPALKLFDDSLSKPQVQWFRKDIQDAQPEIGAFLNVMRARLLEAELLAENGKYGDAQKMLEGNLKFVRLAMGGDPLMIHYLVISGARTLTQNAILRLASKKEMPITLLEKFLPDLPENNSETNLYRHILNVDFITGYEDPLDVRKMSLSWSKVPSISPAWDLFFKEFRRPFRVLIDPSLMILHPKPYDSYADVELTIRDFRIFKANVIGPWADRNGEVELESERGRTNFLNELGPLMELVKDEPLPLSKPAAQRARLAYIQIQNPIGRILECSLSSFVGSDIGVFKSRTERAATRTILALLIFERQKGLLPVRLSDVVEAGILDSIPMDPFADASLFYSRERKLVWSVSLDGQNDNGTDDPKTRWLGADAVWQIPELN